MESFYINRLSQDEVMCIVIKCVNFAAVKHKDQRRKDELATPYINHPLGVANILVQEGDVHDPLVLLAAILHDTVEDTDTNFEELEREFGVAVSNVVREVTDDKNLPKLERKRLQVLNAPNRTKEAKLVTLADKLYNLRDIEKGPPNGWSTERVYAYIKWAKEVIDGCRGINRNLEKELDVIFDKYLAVNDKTSNSTNAIPSSAL